MKGWGAYELARRQAELRAEPEATSGRAEPTWAIGSMEWLAEQNKSSWTRSSCTEVYARALGPLRVHGAKN